MSLIYFAHSYRERDARVVDFFGRLVRSEGLMLSLDPPSEGVNAAKLQRHLNSCDGMVAVLSRREDGTSPHILFEVSLAIKLQRPLLLFIEDTLNSGILSPRLLQQRFSLNSYLRETREHRHAFAAFKGYLGDRPLPRYGRSTIKRTCVFVGWDKMARSLQDAALSWVSQEADYQVQLIRDDRPIRPWRDYDLLGSASLAIVNENSHLAGLVSGMGIPCIELTSDPRYSPDPRLPVEYQPRRFDPARGPEALLDILQHEITLFEQDFLDLADQSAVERYANLLFELNGFYGQGTRDYAEEIIMGDKYETHGQAVNVGPHGHVHDVTAQQIWARQAGHLDLPTLATQLDELRGILRAQAETREQDGELAALGEAATAAEQGDGPQALSHLRRAGRWALNAAASAGAEVATAAIKAALGLP